MWHIFMPCAQSRCRLEHALTMSDHRVSSLNVFFSIIYCKSVFVSLLWKKLANFPSFGLCTYVLFMYYVFYFGSSFLLADADGATEADAL